MCASACSVAKRPSSVPHVRRFRSRGETSVTPVAVPLKWARSVRTLRSRQRAARPVRTRERLTRRSSGPCRRVRQPEERHRRDVVARSRSSARSAERSGMPPTVDRVRVDADIWQHRARASHRAANPGPVRRRWRRLRVDAVRPRTRRHGGVLASTTARRSRTRQTRSVVVGKSEPRRHVVCVVLATTRLDVNGAVRKRLGARKASFASADETRDLTGMEIGGVTPIGLPDGLEVWIDAAVTERDRVVIGGGVRSSKVWVAPADLRGHPTSRSSRASPSPSHPRPDTRSAAGGAVRSARRPAGP